MNRIKSIFVVFLVFSLVLPAFSARLVWASEDSWVPKARMLSTRTSFGFAVIAVMFIYRLGLSKNRGRADK